MSTPNMSGRTDDSETTPGIPASALLNDDGTIDLSSVRARVNGTNTAGTMISTHECDDIRKRLREGASTHEVARILQCGKSSVRRHANGKCHHHPSEVSEPPLRYANRRDGWVVDE